jgi:ABC-type bacteriocin/lantibiotic exporter with double-glycine peptidase domain
LNIILGVIQFIFKTNIVKTTIANQNVNNTVTRDYIQYLQTQHNAILHDTLDRNLRGNYYEFLKIYSSKSKFDSGFEFFQNMIMNIIYISLVLLACYLIINKINLNIGQLILLISLSTMLNSSISNTCEFIIKRIEYKQMVEIYQNFISFSNIEHTGDVVINDVHKIVYKNKKLTFNIRNGSFIKAHKQNILNLLTMNSTSSDMNLFINDIDIRNIQYDALAKKILVINYDTKISRD